MKYHLGYESVARRPRSGKKSNPPRGQSLPSGDRRPGRRGQDARAPAHPRGHRGAPPGPAPAHPRRRRPRRPGHGGGDAQFLPAARLPHRRHAAFRHQQPDRLHHRSGRRPFLALLHRRGQDDRGADFPRERRRSRGRLHGRAAGARFPRSSSSATSSSTWYCFRRHGHNETDEPAFTQPTLYRKIAAHPLVSALYAGSLVGEGSITAARAIHQGRVLRLAGGKPGEGEESRGQQAARGPSPAPPSRARTPSSSRATITPVATGVDRRAARPTWRRG